MRYQALLFDADDTLLDFHAAERSGIERLFAAHGLPLSEELFARYSAHNRMMWQRLERGELTREQLLERRFSDFFKQVGIVLNGAAAEEEYRGYLAQSAQLIPGMKEVCIELKKTHRLFIITNGVAATQWARLQLSGLLPLFEKVFISQEIGAQKPSQAFFDAVLHFLPEYSKKQLLIIGDSLTSDIQGGINAGIDTCWFCPTGKPEQPCVKPTWRMEHPEQLVRIARME